jgi:tetratricopeptide (TPR) repeat protein
MKIRKNWILLLLSCFCFRAMAQDNGTLLQEAQNLERQLKEGEALEKYKAIATADTTHMVALLKTAELSCAVGARVTDKNARKPYYDQAAGFAGKALAAQPNNAQANYVMALVSAKMTEVEQENKKLVQYIKQTKEYADKAVVLNPSFGKAYYMVGKWNADVIDLSWFKKAAIKTLYGGGMAPASLDSAVANMEKCKILEPYFVLNYLELAKLYKSDNKPAKAIEVLNRLVKLPTRTADDVALKAEGKKMLDEML